MIIGLSGKKRIEFLKWKQFLLKEKQFLQQDKSDHACKCINFIKGKAALTKGNCLYWFA
jgi:hypothetical protein